MRINPVHIYARNNQTFGAVSISTKKRTSLNNQKIYETKGKLDVLGSDTDFEKGNKEKQEIEDKISEERRREFGKLPWYRLIKEIKLDHEFIIKEADAKRKNNKQQQETLSKMKKEVKESVSVVDNLEKQIQEAEAQRIKHQKDATSIQMGKYRTDEGFSKIAGYENEKSILYRYFISEIDKEKQGLKANIPNAVLFFGPKGNGKTTFATAFAQEIGCKKPILVSGYGSNTEKVCQSLYKRLEKSAQKAKSEYEATGNRQVLFIDEFDLVSDKNSTILNELEDFLKTCYEKYHCIVFATTNYPLSIRLPLSGENTLFPYVISQDPPTQKNKIAILKYYLPDKLNTNLTEEEYKLLAEEMEAKEDEEEKLYSIAQIRNKICEVTSDEQISFEKLLDNIRTVKPNISQEQLADHINAMEKLMSNIIWD